MWFVASRETNLSHLCHKTYSVVPKSVLGKIGCIVSYNILGIGTANINWKTVKAVKYVHRATTSTIKCKQKDLVYGTNNQIM